MIVFLAQRLLLVHDGRGRLRQQPARVAPGHGREPTMGGAYQEEAPGDRRPRTAPRTPRHRRRGLRRPGLQRHHRPQDRGRGGHARGQPLLPLRFQGIDARRDPLHLPRRALGRVRRRPGRRTRPPGDHRGPGHRVLPGDRPAPRRRRDLPEGVQAPRRPAPLRATSPTRSASSRRPGWPRWSAASPPRSSAPTSTSGSPTASCATPSGSPRPGTGPADSTAPRRSPASTCRWSWTGSPYARRPPCNHLTTSEESPWPRPTSSKRSAPPSGGARAAWPPSTRPTSARTS